MNKEELYNLPKTVQDSVLEEILELMNLVDKYPTDLKELKIFIEWHSSIGKFGNELKNLLIGIYPSEELNKQNTKERLEELLVLSNRALELVSFWNRVVKRCVKEKCDWENYIK